MHIDLSHLQIQPRNYNFRLRIYYFALIHTFGTMEENRDSKLPESMVLLINLIKCYR